jgi:hypothetical protein
MQDHPDGVCQLNSEIARLAVARVSMEKFWFSFAQRGLCGYTPGRGGIEIPATWKM